MTNGVRITHEICSNERHAKHVARFAELPVQGKMPPSRGAAGTSSANLSSSWETCEDAKTIQPEKPD